MPFSKDVIIWSGLCFLGLSAATALYKRKELLSRFNWLNVYQEDKSTTEETSPAKSETSPAKSDIHANDSTNNVTDSDSFFSFTSECDGVCCQVDLTDSSSSCGFEDTTKRSIVLKSGKRDLETDAQNSAFTDTLGLDEQLSSPIVTSMEFQTPRRDVNENGMTCRRLDHIYGSTTPRQRGVIEDVPTSSPQSTSYNRIYDGYRSIVTPNSPTTMVFRANNK
ncbi:uncharacterized protein LOC117324017 [Pecten maximus]|uniref:uncharacterized protein LOC117324017 n=1 Tax=Pecten maximus TaxID=6579 RepID=UPI0014580995|nr:uncharacterized protein LOC117324017 [Pecten maximus]